MRDGLKESNNLMKEFRIHLVMIGSTAEEYFNWDLKGIRSKDQIRTRLSPLEYPLNVVVPFNPMQVVSSLPAFCVLSQDHSMYYL